MIYLDNSASTPLLPQVKDKLLSILDIYGNPSSIHSEGNKAREIINKSKEIIANKLHCSSEELHFTTGATMSNSIILQRFIGDVFTTTIEHEDILLMAKELNLGIIDVDNNGNVNINRIKEICEDYKDTTIPILFSIQLANSIFGKIQDIEKISKLIHSYPNAYLHVDATQYIPYFECDVQTLKIDSLSMSGQKIGCIKGVGLLYLSDALRDLTRPLIWGKQGFIGGTENVSGIACMGVAFENLNYDNSNIIKLRNKLINGLDGTLVGTLENRLPNNICMMFEGLDSLSIVQMLNEKGICCSAGSACSSGDNTPSTTLLAIGLTEEQAKSCVRFSLGRYNTEKEIDETINVTNKVVKFLRELND